MHHVSDGGRVAAAAAGLRMKAEERRTIRSIRVMRERNGPAYMGARWLGMPMAHAGPY